MIPRIIHRIWFGSDLPAPAKSLGATWRALHPDWEHVTWREWNLPPLRNQRLFDECDIPAQKADLVRLEILQRFGGVYVDTDFEARRPLDPLLEGVDCFAASEDGKFVSNAIIGSAPHHPFLTHLVDRVAWSIAAQPDAPPNRQTGPWFTTDELVRYQAIDGGRHPVTVFPPKMFYPYHFSRPERRWDDFPDAYAVHHWASSWT